MVYRKTPDFSKKAPPPMAAGRAGGKAPPPAGKGAFTKGAKGSAPTPRQMAPGNPRSKPAAPSVEIRKPVPKKAQKAPPARRADGGSSAENNRIARQVTDRVAARVGKFIG